MGPMQFFIANCVSVIAATIIIIIGTLLMLFDTASVFDMKRVAIVTGIAAFCLVCSLAVKKLGGMRGGSSGKRKSTNHR